MGQISPSARIRRRIALPWLAVAAIAALLLGVIVLAPGLPLRLIGAPPAPPPPPAPALPAALPPDPAALAAERDAAVARLEPPRRPQRSSLLDEPIERPAAVAFPDQLAAAAQLADARRRYRALDWTAARSAAERVRGLRAEPDTAAAAARLAADAATIAELFRRLDDRDELQRGYDTDPNLVQLTMGGRQLLAVPGVVAADGRTAPYQGRDPVAFLEGQRRSGQLVALVQGRNAFTPTTLPQQRVERIARADLAAQARARREEFLLGWHRLQAGENAEDPTAWYAAARFAYQHRLDDYVADALDQALARDRDLVTRVREDKAATLYAAMVAHLQEGNRRQADAFMAAIARRFADTRQGNLARLFYDGRTGELVAATRAAAAAARPAAPAPPTGAPAPAAAPDPDRPAPLREPAAPPPAGPGDEASADRLATQAAATAREAMDLGNVPQRDTLYRQGRALAEQAMAIYDRLIAQASDGARREALEAKGIAANQVRFMCIKYARPFH